MLEIAGDADKEPNKKRRKKKIGKERGRGKGNRAAADEVGPRPLSGPELFPGYP